MGRHFFGPHAETVTRFQTIFAACSGSCGLCLRLDASGVQSRVQVRLFLALDDGGCTLQHPQCRATPLSLVQSRWTRLLRTLCRFHSWPVSGWSIGPEVDWLSSSGSYVDSRCDLARWVSNGACHSPSCPLSIFDLLVNAPDGFGAEVLRRQRQVELVTRIQESLC
jgi:hypothetical protein